MSTIKYHVSPQERSRLRKEAVEKAMKGVEGPVGFYEIWPEEEPKLTVTGDILENWRKFCKAVWEDKDRKEKCEDDYKNRAAGCMGKEISTCWLGVHNIMCHLEDNSSGSVTLIGGELHVKEMKEEAEEKFDLFLNSLPVENRERFRKLWHEIPERDKSYIETKVFHDFEAAAKQYLFEIIQIGRFRYEEQQAIHDLLILLQSLIGNIEVLGIELKRTFGIGKKWEARFDELIRLCDQNADFLLTRLGNLDNPEFSYKPLGPLIYNWVELYKQKSRGKGIDFLVDLEKVVDEDGQTRVPAIKMAYEYLNRAFHNVLDNAVKYSFGGTADHPRWIEIKGRSTVRQNIPGYSIDISNLGIGIEEDELEKVFEAGYQGRRRKGEFRPGFGVGLAFVKECIEMHGGEVAISSRPQERSGWLTKLQIWLPIHRIT
jgi:signal transduction histidine kinase